MESVEQDPGMACTGKSLGCGSTLAVVNFVTKNSMNSNMHVSVCLLHLLVHTNLHLQSRFAQLHI